MIIVPYRLCYDGVAPVYTGRACPAGARCLFHKYTTSSLGFFLGAPRSSVASGAGLEPGVPRGALAQDLRNGHLDMLTLAQELAHPFSLAYTLYFAAFLHQLRRIQSYLKYGMT